MSSASQSRGQAVLLPTNQHCWYNYTMFIFVFLWQNTQWTHVLSTTNSIYLFFKVVLYIRLRLNLHFSFPNVQFLRINDIDLISMPVHVHLPVDKSLIFKEKNILWCGKCHKWQTFIYNTIRWLNKTNGPPKWWECYKWDKIMRKCTPQTRGRMHEIQIKCDKSWNNTFYWLCVCVSSGKHLSYIRQSYMDLYIYTQLGFTLYFFNVACHTNCWWSPPITCVRLCFMNRLWQAVCGMSLWWIWTCVLWATAYYCQSKKAENKLHNLFDCIWCSVVLLTEIKHHLGYTVNRAKKEHQNCGYRRRPNCCLFMTRQRIPLNKVYYNFLVALKWYLLSVGIMTCQTGVINLT